MTLLPSHSDKSVDQIHTTSFWMPGRTTISLFDGDNTQITTTKNKENFNAFYTPFCNYGQL